MLQIRTRQMTTGVLLALLVVGTAFAQQRRERGAKRERGADAPRVGEVAPKIRLPELSGEKIIDVSGARNGRPVVLIFGSYT